MKKERPKIDPLYQKHWEALHEKAEELGLDTQALLEPTPMHDVGDTAAAAAEKELIAAFLTVKRNIRLLVQWAIQRLLNDEYGRCIHCECQIPDKRLKAIPWAPFCLKCQEKAETGQLQGFDCALVPKLGSGLTAMQ